VCSAGTYVRSLARDLGEAAGSAAYLGALTRTRAGAFTLDEAITIEAIREAGADGPDAVARLMLPMDAGLDSLPSVIVTRAEAAQLAEGRFVTPLAGLGAAATADGPVRARDASGQLVAIASLRSGRLAPEKVLFDRGSAPVPSEGG